MWVYYAVFICAFLLAAFDGSRNIYLKIFPFLAFSLVLIAIPGFRPIGVDNDSIAYVDIFETANTLSFWQIISGDYWQNIERGYMFLNKVVGIVGGDERVLFIIVAALTGMLNYGFFFKVSRYPFISLLFYLSFFFLYRDLTQIRYALSCAIVFWSVYSFLQKRAITGLLLLLLAISFHTTAIIMLVVLPFCALVRNRYLYLSFPILGLVGLVYSPLNLLIGLFGAPEHMSIYMESEGGGGFMVGAIGLVVMFIYTFYPGDFEDRDFNFGFYYRLFAIGVTLSLFFFQISIFQRFSYLLFQFGVVLLPNMFFNLEKKLGPYLLLLIHLLFCIFFLYYGIRMIHPDLIRPYVE
ncbi:hypothetical protein C7T94_04775 [Pedobacter yulinensis]|uniref:EpsG family protein n=1 Tax=Pedobacter yulinensis TaxID=2126353 RepID=A0A2T3HNN1_9SPHI|nr:EpsG family protein [Pedobacter yulinensis]PST84054.1 hypothetical protein C7T94_04775 [Pedobacter yulinensis]